MKRRLHIWEPSCWFLYLLSRLTTRLRTQTLFWTVSRVTSACRTFRAWERGRINKYESLDVRDQSEAAVWLIALRTTSRWRHDRHELNRKFTFRSDQIKNTRRRKQTVIFSCDVTTRRDVKHMRRRRRRRRRNISDWPLLLFGDNMKLRRHTSCLRWAAAGGNTPCLQNNSQRVELTCGLMSSANIKSAVKEMPRPSASIPCDEERFVTRLRSPLDETAAESQRSDRGRQRLTTGGRASGPKPQMQSQNHSSHVQEQKLILAFLRSERWFDAADRYRWCRLNVRQSAFSDYKPDLVLSLLRRCNTWISSSLINTVLILFGSCRQLPPLPLWAVHCGTKAHTHPKK